MRKYQLSIKLSVFDGSRSQEEGRDLHIYTDGNDIWDVICAGFNEMIERLIQTGKYKPVSSGVKQSEWR